MKDFDSPDLFILVRVAVHLDAEVVSLFLPVDLAVSDVEQRLGSKLLAGGDLNQGDPSRAFAHLRYPVSQDVVGWRPGIIPVDGNMG